MVNSQIKNIPRYGEITRPETRTGGFAGDVNQQGDQ